MDFYTLAPPAELLTFASSGTQTHRSLTGPQVTEEPVNKDNMAVERFKNSINITDILSTGTLTTKVPDCAAQ